MDELKKLRQMQTTFAQTLGSEKGGLGDQAKKIKAEMSRLRKEKAKLALGVPSGRETIDSLSPEVHSLKKQLQYVEIHNQLLEHEVSKQHDEIRELERRIENVSSQSSPSSPVDESMASSSFRPLTSRTFGESGHRLVSE